MAVRQPNTNAMNVAIITPIQVELDAILSKVPNCREEISEGIRYLVTPFKGKHHDFNLVLQLGGPNNENTALATEKVVKKYQPLAVILCGVAGGVKDVEVGDVVVGSKYYGYDFGKVTPEGFKTRPESGYYSKDLVALAQSVAANGQWRNRANNNKPCKVIFGAIAAGNKVVTASNSVEYRRLKDDFNNTTAVEMEAVGFSQAMLSYPAIPHINIRGISDLLDGKDAADAAGSQQLAADNMAAFVVEVVWRLDLPQNGNNSKVENERKSSETLKPKAEGNTNIFHNSGADTINFVNPKVKKLIVKK
jgi:nucleoside phosphorylase